jgi:hypothetical protein
MPYGGNGSVAARGHHGSEVKSPTNRPSQFQYRPVDIFLLSSTIVNKDSQYPRWTSRAYLGR